MVRVLEQDDGAAADDGGGDLGTQVRAQLPRGGRGDRRRRACEALNLSVVPG